MSVARSGRSRRGRSRGSTTSARGLAVAKELRLAPDQKKQFELVCEVKPDWTDEEIVSFCTKCNYNANVIEQGLMNAFEDLRPSEDQNTEQWNVISKKEKKKKNLPSEKRDTPGEERDQRFRDGASRISSGPLRRSRDDQKGSSGSSSSWGRRDATAEHRSDRRSERERRPRVRAEPKQQSGGPGAVSSWGQPEPAPSAPEGSAMFPPVSSYVPPHTTPAVAPGRPTYAGLLKRGIEKQQQQQQQQQTVPEPVASNKAETSLPVDSYPSTWGDAEAAPALPTESYSSTWGDAEATPALPTESYSGAWGDAQAAPARPAESYSNEWGGDVLQVEEPAEQPKTEAIEQIEPLQSSPSPSHPQQQEDVQRTSAVELQSHPRTQAHSRSVHQLFSSADPVTLPEHFSNRSTALESTMIQFGNFTMGAADDLSAYSATQASEAEQSQEPIAPTEAIGEQPQQQQVVNAVEPESETEPKTEESSADLSYPSPSDIAAYQEPGVKPRRSVSPAQKQEMQQPEQQVPEQMPEQMPEHAQHLQQLPGAGPSQFSYMPVHSQFTHVPHTYMPYDSEHQASQHAMQAYYDPYSAQQHPLQHQHQLRQPRQLPRGGASYNRSGNGKSRNRDRNARSYGDRSSSSHEKFSESQGKEQKYSQGESIKAGNSGRSKRHHQPNASRGYAPQHQHPYAASHAPQQMAASPMGYAPSSGIYSYPAPYLPQFFDQSQGYVPPHGFGRHYSYQPATPNASFSSYPGAPRGAFPAQSGYEDVPRAHALHQQHLQQQQQQQQGQQQAAAAGSSGEPSAEQPQQPSQQEKSDYEQSWVQDTSQQMSASPDASASDAMTQSASAGVSFDRRSDSFAATSAPPFAYSGSPMPPSNAHFGQHIGQQAFASFPGPQQPVPPPQAAYGEPARSYPHWSQ